MNSLQQYAVSVVAAALLCSIVSGLAVDSAAKKMLRLLGGLILTLSILRPVSKFELPALESIVQSHVYSGKAAAEEGIEEAGIAAANIIIGACEAYILDKANALGADLTASVLLDRDNIPHRVIFSGQIPPDARQRLEVILETDLGIAKENQLWS